MLFVQYQYQYLVPGSMQQDHYVMHQFANGEYTLKLEAVVAGKKCVVLGSLTASPEQSLQLLLLLTTLKKSGASKLVLFSPYLGYQRQDNCIVGEPCGLQFADTLLHAAGVDQIITVEPHNFAALSSLKVPIYCHSVESIFYDDIARFVALGFGFVFPDAGAAMRYGWLLQKFPTIAQGYFTKKRLGDFVQLADFQGKVACKAIIYDDILDSGITLVQTCIALRSMGVEEIVIFVTHAFFHGDAWLDLFRLGVVALYCTNSLSTADAMNHPQIKVLSTVFLLQKSI